MDTDHTDSTSIHDASRSASQPASRKPTSRRRLRLAAAATLLLAVFSVVTYSAPQGDDETLRLSLRRAADRLVALQRPDGTWPRTVGGQGDMATSGRPARALLHAHALTGNRRYLEAATLTADTLARELKATRRHATVGNLIFLAEVSRAASRPDLLDLAGTLHRAHAKERSTADGASAAHELVSRPNHTTWLDGAWRNYLLWHGGEVAELARALGDDAWADDFTLALARSWAPKHDYAWWTMGAGRMLEALSVVEGPEARRLAEAELAALRRNEVMPGLPWNDTPYDTYVYAMEAAASVQGLLRSHDAEARRAARQGLVELCRLQAPSGGWGSTLSLLPGPLTVGSPEWVPDAEMAIDETPELDAEMVLTLVMSLSNPA
jgi:hypothetical protein